MALDYTVQLDCDLKRELGVDGLVAHLKNRMVLELAELFAETRQECCAVAGRGPITARDDAVRATIARIRREADGLSRYAETCAACVANVFPTRDWEVGGCVGFLTLPIERPLEDIWMAVVRQASPDSEDGDAPPWVAPLLACRSRDLLQWRELRLMRVNGEPDFFEYEIAPETTVACEPGEEVVSSNAVCAFLFDVPNQGPEGMPAASRFCTDVCTYLAGATSGPVRPSYQGSRSIEEFLQFSASCGRAEELGLGLRVSL